MPCPSRELRALYDNWSWQLRRTGRYVLLHQPAGEEVPRWSLIEHLELPAMLHFRAAIADRLGSLFADPVPHVTHYVCGDGKGIGLPDRQALASRQVREVTAAGTVMTDRPRHAGDRPR